MIHAETIESYGGTPGYYNYTEDRIESILDQQYPHFGYDRYPKVFDKAAMLMYFFAKDHVFIDGNKRVALQAASVLLQINGYYLVAPQYEVYNVTYSIAETSSDDFQGVIRNISTWLRGRSTTRLRPWNITYRIRPKR